MVSIPGQEAKILQWLHKLHIAAKINKVKKKKKRSQPPSEKQLKGQELEE